MKKFGILLLFIFVSSYLTKGQTTVFSDDFSTNTSATWTTSGSIGASAWSVSRSGDDWGARRNTSPEQLELTNDASGTTNANGWVFASVTTSSFSAPYNTTLSSNTGLVTWSFNMRQIRPDPAGFGSGSYGVAFILAASSTTANNSGNGYAVVLGNTGATDPIRLVMFTGGISSLGSAATGIILSNTSGLTDFGNEYLSIRVTYNPSNGQWELFVRNDGTSFTDPETGSLTSQGTATNTTYTGTALDYLGGYWQGATSPNQTAFFDNVTVKVGAPVQPTIIVSPSSLSDFAYIVGSGPSYSQTYKLSGSNLDPAAGGITVTGSTNYEVSLNGTDFFSSVYVSYTGGTLSATDIYVRLKAGLSAGTYNGELIANSGGGATTQNVTVNGKVLALEPTVQASGVNFTDVTETSFTINWTNGGGASRIVLMKYFVAVDVVPVDGTLYNSNSSFGTISTEIGIGNYVVYKGSGSSVAVTGLRKGRIYHAAVFEYNGSDNYENYLTSSPATGSQRTNGPTLTEIIYPQYMQGKAGTNNNRVPYAYRVQINGLLPSAAYRYYNTVVEAIDGHTTDGAGNVIFATSSGDFVKTTNGGLSTAGNYGEFTTNASGEYTGWFITEPTGNARFTASGFVYMQIILNNGAGGSSVDARLTLDNGVYVMDFGTNPFLGQGTGIRSLSGAPAKDFVFLYDNESGTGRPISGTFAESDGTSGGTDYVTFYYSDVNGIAGAWGTIIPNILPNGIRRIERRLLSDANIGVGTSTSPDGMWGSVNTVNPSGGSTPLVIPGSSAPLPVELASFTASVINGKIKLNWKTETEKDNYGFEVQRAFNSSSTDGSSKPKTWEKIGFVEGSGNSNSPKSYSFTDNNVTFGSYSYRLKQIDTDGKFEYSPVVLADLGTPKEFSLSQNYPNPFNPSTSISFTLPEAVDVKITVFNILGQEVATILNAKKEAGVHTVDFDASELNSGLYIYRMDAGKFSNVRKMLLIK